MIQQISNLISHTVFLIPDFLKLFVLAICILLMISGFSLFLIKKITTKSLFLLPYLSFSLYISFIYLILPLVNEHKQIIAGLFIFTSIIGLIQLFLRRKEILNVLKSERRHLLFWIITIIMVTFSSFLLFKFTKSNGMHDEYFHHAVIQQFLNTDRYPFSEPYYLQQNLDGRYHVGLYFPVIALNMLLPLQLDVTFDLLKIILFIPFIPTFALLIADMFFKGKRYLSLFSSFLAIFSGPSFFLFDSFSKNVLMGVNMPQVLQPVFFQLAGITWFGLPISIIFILFFLQEWIDGKKMIFHFPFLLLSLFSVLLINKAYFYFYCFSLGLSLLFSLLKDKSKKVSILYLVTILLLILFSFYSGKTNIEYAQSYATVKNTTLISAFLRKPTYWGLPYSSINNQHVEYVKIPSLFFLESFGLILIVSIFLMFHIIKQKNTYQTVFLFSLLFPLIFSYVGAYGDNLALNKYLYPFSLFAPIILLIYSLDKKKVIKIILYSVLFFGICSPPYYFLTADNENLQEFWVIKNEDDIQLISFIKASNINIYYTNSQELSYLVANNTNVQIELCTKECKEKNVANAMIINKSTNYLDEYPEISIFENNTYKIYKL